MNLKIVYLALRIALITGLSWATQLIPVMAGGVVGDGTPASCTEAALDTVLAGGGSVTFNCGTAPHTIVVSTDKFITSNTTIDGADRIALSGGDTTFVFLVDSGVTLTLNNITIQNGFNNVGDGGAIFNLGTLNINHSKFLNNKTAPSFSGGAIVTYGPLHITDSEFANNEAGNGGAVYPRFTAAPTTITNSSFYNNRTTHPTNGFGGALLLWDGAPVTIRGSNIFGNTARYGGGLYNGGVLTITHSTLSDNTALYGDGGAIINFGTLNIHHSKFLHNESTSGGAIMTYGPLNIADSEFANNEAGNGGAVYPRFAAAVTTITNSSFHDNQATNTTSGFGGALLLWDGAPVTIRGSNIFGNTARYGGGLYNGGVLTVMHSTLSDNTALHGGGLYNGGVLTVIHSTLSDNTALYGGGVLNDTTGTGNLWAWNSTIDGNRAADGGGGLHNSGVANLYNVTISRNMADSDNNGVGLGGGVLNSAGAILNTHNTLLAVNYRDTSSLLNDCYGQIWSDHSRFTSVPVTCSIVGPKSFTTDPNGIGLLADNGGPTLTVALLPGSDAIDAADPVQGCVNFNSLLATDQRGAPRIAGARCDVGAYEFGSPLPRLFLPLIIR